MSLDHRQKDHASKPAIRKEGPNASLGYSLLAWAIFCCLAPTAQAQTVATAPIRVQSNAVLVPVLVLDKGRVAQLQDTNPSIFFTEIQSKDFRAWSNVVVRGLTSGDFQVLEDGQEQRVDGITIDEHPTSPLVQDNLGEYQEFTGIGGGIWVVPVNPAQVSEMESRISNATTSIILPGLPDLPEYLVAYAQPASPEGSCHKVTVKTKRPGSLVYARNEYCNEQGSAADPLSGTNLGKKIASELDSKKKPNIALSLTAFATPTGAPTTRVHIFLEFPLQPLVVEGNRCAAVGGTIDILGMIYSKGETIAARFSDLADRNNDNLRVGSLAILSLIPGLNNPRAACPFYEPNRYETQLELAPGQYDLHVALSDGKKFGRAEMPLVVDSYNGKQLTISEIALVKHFRQLSSGSQTSATTLPAGYAPLVSKEVEVTPTADTRFKKGGPFYFYLQVYNPVGSGISAANIEAHLRIVDPKTSQVVKSLEPASAASYAKPGDPVIPIGGGIDISALPSGSYLLEAQATDSNENATPWRSVKFTIAP